MPADFSQCPFQFEELKVRAIYRSLSPGNFFITFSRKDGVFKAILIDTLYNSFAEYIAGCSTVWDPDFEQMKALLLLAVKVKPDYSEEDRLNLLKSNQDTIEFGAYDFNGDCMYSLDEKGQYVFRIKTYKFVIDNGNKEIRIVHNP